MILKKKIGTYLIENSKLDKSAVAYCINTKTRYDPHGCDAKNSDDFIDTIQPGKNISSNSSENGLKMF